MDYILVVDDSQVARMWIVNSLSEALGDIEFLQAANGDEAVAHVQERGVPPLLAIVDYNMPGMNGLEFTGWLEGAHPGTPKVLCTANTQDALARRAGDAGVPVVGKPFSMDRLKEAVELPVIGE